MSKFITDEILGEREKRILGSFVSLVNPTSRSQSVEKDQIILKDNKYYSVIKSGTVDFSTSVPNAEYLKPLNLKSGGGGLEVEVIKKTYAFLTERFDVETVDLPSEFKKNKKLNDFWTNKKNYTRIKEMSLKQKAKDFDNKEFNTVESRGTVELKNFKDGKYFVTLSCSFGTMTVQHKANTREERDVFPTEPKFKTALSEISDRIFYYAPIADGCLFKKDQIFNFSLSNPDYTAEYKAYNPFFHVILFEVKNNKILKVFELKKVKINYYSFLFNNKRLRILLKKTESSTLEQEPVKMVAYDKNKITLKKWLTEYELKNSYWGPPKSYISQLLTLKVLKIKEE